MIITKAMPTPQTATTGVSHPIAAGQGITSGLCRGPGAAVINEGTDGTEFQPWPGSVSEQLSEHLQVRLVRMPFLRLAFE